MEPHQETHREPRQDIYAGGGIELRWILVGGLIVLGLECLVSATLAAFGMPIESLGIFLLATTVAFFGGGALIGWMSPGYTPWEGGFACVLAALGTVFLAARLLDFGDGFLVTVPIALAWGLLCGLAGGHLGERIQGPEGRSR